MFSKTITTTTTQLGSSIATTTTTTTTNNKKKKKQKKNLGCIVLLAPQRNLRSGNDVWNNIDRFCLLLRCIRSIDQYLNYYWGPYPIYILIAKDYQNDPLQKDAQYTIEDRKLIRSWASKNSTIYFVEIDLYSGRNALGYYDTTTTTTTSTINTNSSHKQMSLLNVSTVLQWRKGYEDSVPGRDLGYTSMCRLWSGRIQQMDFLTGYHTNNNGDGDGDIEGGDDDDHVDGRNNNGYEYYLRMDDDSLFTSPFTYDPFLKMKQRQLLYVYKRTAVDHWGIQQLWDISKPYIIQQHKDFLIRQSNNNTTTNATIHYTLNDLPFVYVTSTGDDDFNPINGDDDDQVGEAKRKAGSGTMIDSSALDHIHYSGDQPYNNFHLSKVEFWNTPSWKNLYDELNSKHVFYKYRVGDANVHAIAVMMMPFGTYEEWSGEIDDDGNGDGNDDNALHIPYVHNSNDMKRGWAPKEWQVECQQAYDRYNITSK